MSGVLLTGQQPAGPAFTPAPAQFGQGITLRGTRVEPAAGGAGVTVTLFWSATQPPASSDTIFVHVLDAHQQLLGQHDGVPAGGALPMALWGLGITVVDPHPVSLTAPLAPGALLCVGAYDPVTLDRLDVQPAAGYDVHDNQACRPLVTQP